jgi:hypothetical protein
MHELTPEGQQLVSSIAHRHGVSVDAALTLLRALVAGHGAMAQFSHAELGGMGQWSQGGMTMVGDMFNHGLKARVDALCTELASLLRNQPSMMAAPAAKSQHQSSGHSVSLFVPGGGGSSGAWWPSDLGQPSSAGSQNDLRYAFFAATHRLAIGKGGHVTLYDTGDHLISGVSQQQGGGKSLTFTSQHGVVKMSDLREVRASSEASVPEPQQKPPNPQPTPSMPSSQAVSQAVHQSPQTSPAASDDVFAALERLAELQKKGVLTDEEFAAKKAELLARI